jgi:hypothetical protein
MPRLIGFDATREIVRNSPGDSSPYYDASVSRGMVWRKNRGDKPKPNPFFRARRWQACQTRVTTKSYKFPELREPVLFETALDIESAAPLFF